MKTFVSGLLLAVSLLPGSAAHAVLVLEQNLTFTPTLFGTGSTSQTLSFNQFDTSGGRFILQAVEISWNNSFNSNITATSGSGNTRTLQTTASFTSSLNSAGSLFSFSNVISGTSPQYTLAGQGSTATFPISGSASNSFSATNLLPFIGTGTISVVNTLSGIQGNITRLAGGQGSQSLTGGTALGNFSIIYHFVDDIPEPSTWGMLILGFGMVGSAMRRRRSAPVHAA
jgi:hypothetical protein